MNGNKMKKVRVDLDFEEFEKLIGYKIKAGYEISLAPASILFCG